MLGVLEDALARDDDLNLTSPAFENGGPLPDWTGFVNENENPPSTIGGVPDEAESLVSTIVHPEAADVVDHAWVHWTAWGIDPETEQIPRDWDALGPTAGYRDFPRQGHGGPSPPPESVETYRSASMPSIVGCRSRQRPVVGAWPRRSGSKPRWSLPTN